tara:strand:+ start:304 stop:468 length:165 start_codon:yes stop_codon:yes gene_type:complete
MPDTKRYTSVSVNKKTHQELTKLKSQFYHDYGYDLSIAKIIEKLAVQEVRKYGE